MARKLVPMHPGEVLRDYGDSAPNFVLASQLSTLSPYSTVTCPCFETLAPVAPQHEVVVFQHAKPHPEEPGEA
jgi:hypothetical protein